MVSCLSFLLIFIFLPLIAFSQGPPLPYIQDEICEGESGKARCALFTKGIFQSPKSLSVFAKPLDKKPITTIPAAASFEALNWRMYTLETQPCEIWNVDDQMEEYQFKKGEKFYPLSYEGEGFFRVWYGAKVAIFDMKESGKKSFRCPRRFQTYSPYPYYSEYWTKIKYNGKIYWWPSPEECTRFAGDKECAYRP